MVTKRFIAIIDKEFRPLARDISCCKNNFLWNVTVGTSYDQQLYFRKSNLQQNIDCNFCSKLQKMIQVSKIIFKADWLGVIIVQLSFAKPKLEVYIFNRATLSSFSKTEFTKKEDLIKTNRYFHLLAYLFGLPKNKKTELFSRKKVFIQNVFVVLKLNSFCFEISGFSWFLYQFHIALIADSMWHLHHGPVLLYKGGGQ